jgi:two-component sensor histidine kinase
VKNTLVTVQSLAAQSFGNIGESNDRVAAARGAFEARLFALARGHDLLTRQNWEGASLTEIVDQAFVAFRESSDDCRRIQVTGEDLRVTPQMALSLSMVLHELCTNALKYGSLKAPDGRVLVTWQVSDDARLILRWQERDGPPVVAPARRGFGSRLIQDGLARELNGVVHLDYELSGVVCTIDVPLS